MERTLQPLPIDRHHECNFSQFVGITSDLGLLTMDDISNAVTSVSTGVPEPTIMAILLATGAGWTCVAFCRKRRFR